MKPDLRSQIEALNIEPVKTKMVYEVDEFNSVQNKIYKQTLFGLNLLEKEELTKLSKKEKDEIKKKYLKTQKFINSWKQQLCNEYTNKLLKSMFPNSSLIKEILEFNSVDPTFINFIDFKFFKISKKQIVDKLIEQNLLPKHFYNL